MPKPIRAPECPYLGLQNDPGTALAYSAVENRCFRCQVPGIPSLQHQDEFCLTEKHADCPVFAEEAASLPEEIRQPEPRPQRGRRGWRLTIAIGLMGALLLGALGLWNGLKNAPQPTASPSPLSASETPTLSATPAPSATATPSATPTPEDTPIPQAGYALDTPFIINGRQFILHRVIEGEQLVLLARNYETSVNAIFAVNYQMTLAAAGSVIVILPKSNSAQGLPAFWVHQVTQDENSLEAVTQKLGGDLAQTQAYNHCSGGCLLTKDSWLLIAFPAPGG
ncbi:MAG: hypothetical protein Fur0035_11960 [Anaerolineales bacterium]